MTGIITTTHNGRGKNNSSITGVNDVAIVTEPTLSGLHDMKRTFELIQKFNIHQQVIINKYDLNNDVSAMIEDYCQKRNIPIAGKIPFDPLVTEAMVQQRAVTESGFGDLSGIRTKDYGM